MEVEDRYRFWAEEASKLFGGLDICTVDVLVAEADGKEYILEINGTSSGLAPEFIVEDNQIIKELLVHRMNEALCTGDEEDE